MKVKFNDTKIGNNKLYRRKYPIFGKLEENITYTFSGKSAISILLRYFRKTGILENKTDQILVPRWLGTWIYITIHKFCFPSLVYGPGVKGIFVYHQWGFPQNMDDIMEFCREKNLFCIEDCAHAFESSYKGKRVGTYGDASLFSLAKFFSCVAGGAIYTESPQIKVFIESVLKEHNSALGRKVFHHRAVFDSNPSFKNLIELERNYAIYDKILRCDTYALGAVRQQLKEGALQKRQRNYRIFLEEFNRYGFAETLSADGIMPWIFPLFLKEKHRKKVAMSLTEKGIESGLYHFDINRNMLKPDFKECVAIPCHQGLSENNILRIIEIVKKAVKST